VLLEALEATHAADGTDFGGHLLPTLVDSHRLMAYDFTTNRIDGVPAGCDAHYWRDVGTLDAYFAAQMDTLGAADRAPRFDMQARCWPIRGESPAYDPARREWSPGQGWSSIGQSARVEQSILRAGVSIADRAEVSRCILGDNVEVGPGCRLRNVIIEADNKVPPGFEVGVEPDRDHEWLPVSEGGVVVIPRGFFSTTVLAQAVSAGVGRGAGPAITPIGLPTGLAATVSPGKQAALAATTGTVMPMVPSLSAGAAPVGARRREPAEQQPSTQAARA